MKPYTFKQQSKIDLVLDWGSRPALMLKVESRKEAEDMANALFDQIETDLHAPLPLDGDTTAERRMRELFEREPNRWIVLSKIMPSMRAIRHAVERSRGQKDGVLIGLALEHHRRTEGNYPESLNELVPRWMPAVPVDRITGEPLKYHIVDGRPVVYSVGGDKDDDGGRIPREAYSNTDFAAGWESHVVSQIDGDWILWPRHDLPMMADPAEK